MKNFEYAAPRTEAEVLDLLSSQSGKTEVLAGGTDLVGLMKKMVVTPDRVVNIMEVESLKYIEPAEDGGVVVGAAVTLDQLMDSPYLEAYPGIQQAIAGISSLQLQCQGTLGGELCQRPRCWFYRQGQGLLAEGGAAVAEGDNRYHAIFDNSGPAKFVSSSRIAPVLLALGAHLRIIGPTAQEEQFLAVDDFYRTPRHEGQREYVLQPDQLVTHIILPPVDGRLNSTYEVRHGSGPDFPLAAAATALRHSGGVVREAKIVLGQVAPTPWVALEAGQFLEGLTINEAVAEEAGTVAVSKATPLAHNQYKVQLAKVAVKRSVLLAAGLETGGF